MRLVTAEIGIAAIRVISAWVSVADTTTGNVSALNDIAIFSITTTTVYCCVVLFVPLGQTSRDVLIPTVIVTTSTPSRTRKFIYVVVAPTARGRGASALSKHYILEPKCIHHPPKCP
jgi:hypothetical protein